MDPFEDRVAALIAQIRPPTLPQLLRSDLVDRVVMPPVDPDEAIEDAEDGDK